jgi:hypothetical protein
VLVCLALPAGPASAEGILEALSGTEEALFSHVTTRTKDALGTTTKIDSNTYAVRGNSRLNYNLLPNLNINAGYTYDRTISELSGTDVDTKTDITRIRPYAWLTLRDPVFSPSIGYELAEDTTKVEGQPGTTLKRETYTGNVIWRPLDLPATQARYTRTALEDDKRAIVDTKQDQVFLKSEYILGGLDVYYIGTYLDTRDDLRDVEVKQITHEGKLLYATKPLLGGRLTVTTDNRIRYTDVTSNSPSGGAFGLNNPFLIQVTSAPSAGTPPGLLYLTTTPGTNTVSDLTVVRTTTLADGDLVTPATSTGSCAAPCATVPTGMRLVDPADTRSRNIGLDFGSAVPVSSLSIWVAGDTCASPCSLPASTSGLFTWQIYTSTDGATWTAYGSPGSAPFGPFDNRFQIDFPTTTTRYIKAVTSPVAFLPGGFPSTQIFVTELQAFVNTAAAGGGAGGGRKFTQLVRNHNLDVRFVLLRGLPFLYYRFNADYEDIDTEPDPRYIISNGLFLTHRFNPVFASNANASYEFGGDHDGRKHTAILYYASLTATPLPTLTDSLVFSGNAQTSGDSKTTTNSVVLYNTAQLYRGIDATLNLGEVFTTDEQPGLSTLHRQESYVNVGTAITPHPSLSFTAYYLGKLTHASGGITTSATADVTENRVDLTVSFSPFRTLQLAASANIASETGQPTTVIQNYGLNWAPFPDGNLQFSFSYTESHQPNDTRTRIVQPGVRWYFTSRRRSFLEASYQLNTSDSPSLKTESQGFTTRAQVAF